MISYLVLCKLNIHERKVTRSQRIRGSGPAKSNRIWSQMLENRGLDNNWDNSCTSYTLAQSLGPHR